MRWKGGRRSGNIEDRRGMRGGTAAGGVGVGAIAIAAVAYFVFGLSPEEAIELGSQVGGGGAQQQSGVIGSPDDEAGAFVDIIETSNSDVWSQLLRGYTPPSAVVIYDQATGTACGTGQAAMGPFYCPADQRVYLDLDFWTDLERDFGASGEFARAYVIAHEVGHHVQNLTGQLEQSRRMGAQGAESGAVRAELQADCYAGVWAHHMDEVSGIYMERGDLESGLAAASGVGDDTIQRRTQGRVVPDAFTHGTSEQRMRWFRAGYDSGDPNRCDTFSARQL